MDSKDWDKIAKNYFKEIESPFEDDVISPLKKDLKDISTHSAIDLGCGIGNLLPIIKDKFKEITCIDFSKEMINECQKRFPETNNTTFSVGDISNLKSYYNSYDYAFAINSIVQPSIELIDNILKEIYKTLKKNGTFIAVFPSLDSDVLRAAITFDKTKSIKETHQLIGSKDYDFLLGFYKNNGKQKHFFKEELLYRLKKANFKNIKFSKGLYPWGNCTDESLRTCKEENKLFDWYVNANKL